MKNSCRAAAEVTQSSCVAAAELLTNCYRNSCGMAVSEGSKGFGGGLFTKIPEILAKKIAK